MLLSGYKRQLVLWFVLLWVLEQLLLVLELLLLALELLLLALELLLWLVLL
jgi:hypothetical protein